MISEGHIPKTGLPPKDLLQKMEEVRGGDCQYLEGKTFGLVYHLGGEHEKLMQEVHTRFLDGNFLNPMAFPSIRQFETELVKMGAHLVNGPEEAVGCVTSGGTESIILACLASRDRKGAKGSEIVFPETGHVAFEKAAHLLGLKIRKLPLREDYRADISQLQRLINRKTCLVVLSAPQYPHGVIDPIEEGAAICQAAGVPLHVDACIGGFLLPWLEELGEELPAWDFRVPGVTSMSLDIHKYGYCPKGASLLLYRSMDWMESQFFVSTEWPGGVYASTTLAGSRPGNAIAAAFASVMSLGREGFLHEARSVLSARNSLVEGVAQIPSLTVVAPPQGGCLALASNDKRVNIFAVGDLLSEKGWFFDRQQNPQALHFTVMPAHAKTVDSLVTDLSEAAEKVLKSPDLNEAGQAAVYGMMAKSPLRNLVRSNVLDFMKGLYSGGEGAPSVESPKLPPGAKTFLKIFGRRA